MSKINVTYSFVEASKKENNPLTPFLGNLLYPKLD